MVGGARAKIIANLNFEIDKSQNLLDLIKKFDKIRFCREMFDPGSAAAAMAGPAYVAWRKQICLVCAPSTSSFIDSMYTLHASSACMTATLCACWQK